MVGVVKQRRIYDLLESDGGLRVLVDRIWPRGISKDAAALDEWAKVLAPSTDLRQWYGHDPERFAEFRRRYLDELADDGAQRALTELRRRAGSGPITLLTATRHVELSQVPVLAECLAAER